MHVRIYVHMYICIYMCVYIYIYVYICVYICIHVYRYQSTKQEKKNLIVDAIPKKRKTQGGKEKKETNTRLVVDIIPAGVLENCEREN